MIQQYSIAQTFFDLPKEERDKPELRCDFGKGNYFGFRAVSSMYNLSGKSYLLKKKIQSGEKKVMGTAVLDNVESWNFPKYIPELTREPRHNFFKVYETEIEDFSRVSSSGYTQRRRS
jgi:hypothetical protein